MVDATRPPWLALARALFVEYGNGLGIDLAFQRFDDELAALPGLYAPPRGRLLVAEFGGYAQGCVALRELDPTAAELKRLYVRPQARGRGVGRRLAEAAISAAGELEYRRIVLDTLPNMTAAQRLYRELGFRETAPYTFNAVAGTRFMELYLDGRG